MIIWTKNYSLQRAKCTTTTVNISETFVKQTNKHYQSLVSETW